MLNPTPLRRGVALGLFLILALPASAAIIKGPYLIYPGQNDQMMILWQMDSPTPCTLDWGTDADCRTSSTVASEYNAEHQFKQRLTGLTPGRKYFFRVREEGQSHPGSFLAAPPAAASTLKFLAYGDTRTNVNDDDAVCAAMNKTYTADPAYQTFALHVGDRVSEDSETAWTKEFFMRGGAGRRITELLACLPLQGCIGDHEASGQFYKKYWPYPYATETDYYWSFDYGPAHFAILDQRDSADGLSDRQVEWLKHDLAATKKEWKFLVFHKPAWTALNLIHRNDRRAQQVLQPLCLEYGVDICFCGHVHCYAHCAQSGVQYLTLGGGGAPRYSVSPLQPGYVSQARSTLHYAKLEIDGHVLHCEAIKPDGTVIDAFTITHPESGQCAVVAQTGRGQ